MKATHDTSGTVTHLVTGQAARKVHTPLSAAIDAEVALQLLEGRWKLLILFHLFDGQVQRYSDLEKRITGISQKMLAQQLRQLEADGLVTRTVHAEVPPRVEYRLSDWGQALCPALDGLLQWLERRETLAEIAAPAAISSPTPMSARQSGQTPS
ncbi:helix-turn-helix domain-containing protein [Leptospira sp. 96542]|nr:helix-turn-helix domain-containing protein [Leptospira sp. 96542]